MRFALYDPSRAILKSLEEIFKNDLDYFEEFL